MQVLLTGGSGSVGKAVVDRLVQQGYAVRVIGRKQGVSFEGAEYVPCDINDFAHLLEVMRGCDQVIHLAAIPGPGGGSPEMVFSVNCQGTFNVFQAAAQLGIRHIVQASSINAAGQYYGLKPAPLHYLPLDEEHPVFSTDAYSFSKHIIEEIGDYFWRREGISSVAYRLPWVAPQSYHETVEQNRARIKALVNDLLQRTPEQQRDWFERAWQAYNAFRAQRPYETHGLARQMISSMADEESAMYYAMMNRVNFFTALDERDSAQAMERGLTAPYDGSHALFINDSHNWTGVDSRVLAQLFYPDVARLAADLKGTESLVSIDQARKIIGFEPEYSFREENPA